MEDPRDKMASDHTEEKDRRKGSPLAGCPDKDIEGPSSTIDDGFSVYESSLLKKYADKIHHVKALGKAIEEDAAKSVEGADTGEKDSI